MADDILPLRIRDLRYAPGGREVLAGVDLELGPEGITLVLGPNGAGKSVLLRTICGLIRPGGGDIEWGGAGQVGGVPPGHRVKMVFQHPMVLRASVLDNVALGLKPLGVARGERRRRAQAVLERVGLAHRAEDSARQLSGGEQQRLALARAWLTRPRLLLLDEPTASLDPSASAEVERIIREIRTDGTRILMVTHNLGQATRLGDDIVFMAAGRVCEQTSVQRFFARPQSEAARLFIQGELPWKLAF
ncbi:phosphate ABC transporter ATP-binding protein [Thauera aromatica]|nr:phosphate ABC transporter ATP-binding protein [Thauera aromatica]MCK2126580.1 phosphate ABC transporter ATP-binding protein [Thauera aromatica]